MATEPSSTFTVIDQELFEAGDYVRQGQLRTHVLQNLRWLYTDHNHDGGSGDGGLLSTANPNSIIAYGVIAWSGPVA